MEELSFSFTAKQLSFIKYILYLIKMSYISLLNETNASVDNVSTDTVSVALSFTSLGSTTLNNTNFTGSLSGFLTAVTNGSDLTYTYDPATKTFTIQLNNNSISLNKLVSGTAQNQVLLTGVSPFAPTYQTLNTSFITENTNLYYTDARFDTRLGAKTTTNLTEGTNLYYTNARVNTYLTTTNPLSISSSSGGTNIYGSTSSGSIYIKSFDLTSSTLIALDNTTGVSTTALPITIYNGAVKSVDLTTSGINISTGLTYKINNVALRTSEIPENTNLYYTDLRARSSISTSNTATINHSYSNLTGVLSSNLTYSNITIGSTSVSLGGTITSLTGMNSYSGSGNISSTAGKLQSLSGSSDILTPSTSTASIIAGLDSFNSGVIHLKSSSDILSNKGSVIQQNTNGNLYIDNSNTTSTYGINISTLTNNNVTIGSLSNGANSISLFSNNGNITISPNTGGTCNFGGSAGTVNIANGSSGNINVGSSSSTLTINGNTNFSNSRPKYNNGSFNGFKTVRYSTFSTTAFTATNTIWYPMREGTSGNNLVLSYTGVIGDIIELKVRLSGAYNSGTGQYMYFDIHKGTQPSAQTSSTQVSLVTNTTATTSGWGCHLIGPSVFQGVHFSIVYTFTVNETTNFFPVFRTQTTASCVLGSATVNLNPYAEFSIQRIF